MVTNNKYRSWKKDQALGIGLPLDAGIAASETSNA